MYYASDLKNRDYIRISKDWPSDPYFVDALNKYATLRKAGLKTVELDLDAIESVISNGDGPAYRLFDAMIKMQETEGDEGYRGVPRVLLAVIQHLSELSNSH